MAKLFGTDGVRGLANQDLTPELAFKLGRAAGTILKPTREKPAIIVGRDTRLSGLMLEGALTAGICSAGVDVFLAGVVPTPAVAYLTRTMNTCAGAVISASHNPAPDNGLKFFNHQGFKLDDFLEEKIEKLIEDGLDNLPRPVGKELGRVILLSDAGERYLNYLCEQIPVSLAGLRIVLDLSHGAAFDIVPRLFNQLGAQVIALNDLPDGLNINDKCGSTHPQGLQEAVLKFNAHLGLAYDGDADRVIAVDEQGQLVNGDQILVICGLALHEKNLLGKKVVATVMSNLGLKKAFEEAGVEVIETKVGDRYVIESMLNVGATLGGEQSGHVIFLEHSTTGDGILTSLKLLQVIKEKQMPLSVLAGQMNILPQLLVNVRVKEKKGWDENPEIKKAILLAQQKLNESGRLFVRASGTEPLIRVMGEGPHKKQLEAIVQEVAFVIEKELS